MFIILILITIFCEPAFALEPYTLDKIVVKANESQDTRGSSNNNYSVQTFTSSDIKEKNLNSLADILNYVSGMDLRYRSPQGIQGDLSLQGSSFEQVAVLIDGVRVVDPQTGHHNLDIPLTIFDFYRTSYLYVINRQLPFRIRTMNN